MTQLNAETYTVMPDNLIYDSKHPIDAENLEITLSGSKAGKVSRGQVIDVSNGAYSIHANNGTPSAIAAEDTAYEAEDTSVVVPCFVSGSFRQSEIVADPALTDANIEMLRSKGIFLK